MLKTLYRSTLCLTISLVLMGCATRDVLSIPKSTPTMLEIFHGKTISEKTDLNVEESEIQLRHDDQESDSRTTVSAPVIHVYVYPKRDEQSGFFTPGYWIAMPLENVTESIRDSQLD